MVAPVENRILQSSNPMPALPPVTMNTRPAWEPGARLASVSVGLGGQNCDTIFLSLKGGIFAISLYPTRIDLDQV